MSLETYGELPAAGVLEPVLPLRPGTSNLELRIRSVPIGVASKSGYLFSSEVSTLPGPQYSKRRARWSSGCDWCLAKRDHQRSGAAVNTRRKIHVPGTG